MLEEHGYGFTLADALLGIETSPFFGGVEGDGGFTLADALLGIETGGLIDECIQGVVSLWLMPF